MSTPIRRCPPNTQAYTIKPGDTFYGLARRFNTTVPAIISANPQVDPQRLRVGQTVCIPGQRRYPPCPEGNYYTIRAGDTLYQIARRYRISVDDLIEANPFIEPTRLEVGEVICIPLATAPVRCPEGAGDYVIKPGDTFYAIARRYGIGLETLLAANPGLNPDALLVGQVICIPD